jgi:hypothetical protein
MRKLFELIKIECELFFGVKSKKESTKPEKKDGKMFCSARMKIKA